MTLTTRKTRNSALPRLKKADENPPASTILVDSEIFTHLPDDQRDSATFSEHAPALSGRDEEKGYSGREIRRWSKREAPQPVTPQQNGLADNIAKQRRLARWTLMIGVRDLLYLKAERDQKPYPERSAYCLRVKVPGRQPSLMHSASEKKARYKNFRTCGSVWACPVCGSRISEVRRGELATALEKSTERGWQVFMLTFTIQHEDKQRLRELVDLLKAAYTDFRNGRGWDLLKARLAIEGSVQGKETTHGSAGWHPHLHVLFFSSLPEFPAHSAADFLKQRWMRMVSKHGGYCTYDNGLQLSISTDSKLVEYPAKLGLADLDIGEGSDFEHKKAWSIASELAKAAVKQGKVGSRTPAQLVAAAMVGDEQAGELWIEYYETFKGQKQLYWSQGLKEKLGLNDELDDQTIAESALDDELEMMILTDDILKALDRNERGKNARGLLLEIASAGSVDQVWHFLAGLGVTRPADDETFRIVRVDLDDMSVTPRGEVSGAALREMIERGEVVGQMGGDDDDQAR